MICQNEIVPGLTKMMVELKEETNIIEHIIEIYFFNGGFANVHHHIIEITYFDGMMF